MPAAATPAQGPAALAAVRELARSALARTGTPGVAAAVVIDDRVELAEGFGVLSAETGVPVTPDALFQIGSMTKIFTAAAVLVAAERGIVDLERPVGHYVPGLAPCLAKPTLGQLLSHTAGLIDEPDEYGPHDEGALASYARSWTDEYCLFPPGRAFSYSNSGFALAGLALQEASGKPYADAMNELVFAPLGMTRTTFRPTSAMTWPLAVGHRVVDGRPVVVRPMADDARLSPAGEMFSSVRDLSRFAIAFLNAGRLEGRQVLPPSVLRRMQEPRAEVVSLGSRYGFGLFLDDYRGEPRAGHDGTMPGFGAVLATIPAKRVAVVLLANREAAVLTDVSDQVLDVVLGSSTPPAAPPAEAAALPLEHGEAERCVGSFTNPRRFSLEIAARPEGLVLRLFGRELPLVKTGPGRFVTRPPQGQTPRTVTVRTGDDGRAESVQFALWSFARAAPAPQ